jgi:trehalose 6-phosphate synthase/phosphatase
MEAISKLSQATGLAALPKQLKKAMDPKPAKAEEAAKPKVTEVSLVEEIAELYEKLARVREQMQEAKASDTDGSRVILVARQLPFVLTRQGDGWHAEPHADAYSANKQDANSHIMVAKEMRPTVWVGWPGADVEPAAQSELRDFLLGEHSYLPVFIDERKEAQFHRGFCRQILWPLFHSTAPTTEDLISTHAFEPADGESESFNDGDDTDTAGSIGKLWQAYSSVNQAMADNIRDHLNVREDSDVIWIHDYHFLLLPQMLRTALPSAKIGFFLHVPFPSSELYRILPFREALLSAMLHADLIGFQTYDYARHFLSSCEAVLFCDVSPKGVEYNDHFTEICICPVGIDPEAVAAAVNSPDCLTLRESMGKQFSGRSVLLGVDLLDATKGLVHKFLAIEALYRAHPELAESCTFVQIGIAPVDSDRREVAVLEAHLNSIVTRINAEVRMRSGRVDTEDTIQYLIGGNFYKLQQLKMCACIRSTSFCFLLHSYLTIFTLTLFPFTYFLSLHLLLLLHHQQDHRYR